MDQKSNGAAPKPANEIDRITAALDSAYNLVSRVEQMAETLLGPAPAPPGANTGQIQQTPSGALPRLVSSASGLYERIGDAMVALDRIERAVV